MLLADIHETIYIEDEGYEPISKQDIDRTFEMVSKQESQDAAGSDCGGDITFADEELWQAAEMGRTDRLAALLDPAGQKISFVVDETPNPPYGSSQASLRSSSKNSLRSSSPMSTSLPNEDVVPAGFQNGGSWSSTSLPIANINSRALHGRTALHIAASNGHTECLEMILKLC